jgi:hypothetical protein
MKNKFQTWELIEGITIGLNSISLEHSTLDQSEEDFGYSHEIVQVVTVNYSNLI